MTFYSDFEYTCREDKPRYVWEKYKSILKGKILDVGADQCGLKKFLPTSSEYVGTDRTGVADVSTDLEKEKLPFGDNSFDCVLCLDVLEHLDNIHNVFDELCRVTRKYLIISLPNPWAGFMTMLRTGYYKHTQTPMKFYSLPPQLPHPHDRHKWFYGAHEAERFLLERGKMNGMKVIQMDREERGSQLKRKMFEIAGMILFHKDVDVRSLTADTVWAVLEKCS